MDRDRLKGYLDQGLSLIEIGALENRDPSTVGYWVSKHGLEANGKAKYAPRGGLDREQLAPLVEQGFTLRRIADELGRSMSTVQYWIRRYGLDAPRKARRKQVERALAEGLRTLTSECKRHGSTVFVIENSGRIRCRQCRMDRVSAWRRRTKAKLVEEAGGRCVLCGYSACQAALQFHHLDPTQKDFHLADKGATRAIEALRKEVAKCVLLCSNCHAEVEVGFSCL